MGNGVQVVTIKSIRPLYKNGEPAERIELVNCDEHMFDVVSQKGLYAVGDKAIYIQPDFSLKLPRDEGVANSLATKLFLDFTMPSGDPKKSKLGKGGRVRAIKFNFQLERSSDPVYSVGILMPLIDVCSIMGDVPSDDLDTWLEVEKWQEPESMSSGMSKGKMPDGCYITDETNIKNLRLEFPMKLTGTLKIDGSSITIYYRDEERQGICSRNLEKYLDQTQTNGYTTVDGKNVRKHYSREDNIRGWMLEDSDAADSVFYREADPTWVPITTEVDDTFVKLGKPVLAKLRDFCVNPNGGTQIALRGELCGQGLKGSGNKNNPHSKLPQQIIFYALDSYVTGVTRRCGLETFYDICKSLDLATAPVIFSKVFNSMEELSAECNEYFKTNLIEGIVVKNDDASFSAKFMNDYYDSKK